MSVWTRLNSSRPSNCVLQYVVWADCSFTNLSAFLWSKNCYALLDLSSNFQLYKLHMVNCTLYVHIRDPSYQKVPYRTSRGTMYMSIPAAFQPMESLSRLSAAIQQTIQCISFLQTKDCPTPNNCPNPNVHLHNGQWSLCQESLLQFSKHYFFFRQKTALTQYFFSIVFIEHDHMCLYLQFQLNFIKFNFLKKCKVWYM